MFEAAACICSCCVPRPKQLLYLHILKAMEKNGEPKDTEKYCGGKIGHRSWLKAMDRLTFNEPIFAALWNNVEEDVSVLNSPPEWRAEWKIEDRKVEWKKVLAYGMKWFPLNFGSADLLTFTR